MNAMKNNFNKSTLLCMGMTGGIGGLIGSFLGRVIYVMIGVFFGILLGWVIGRMGGQRFSLFVAVGALLGSQLAIYLGGSSFGLLGAATGGSIGGFCYVNLSLFQRES